MLYDIKATVTPKIVSYFDVIVTDFLKFSTNEIKGAFQHFGTLARLSSYASSKGKIVCGLLVSF